jgi:DNA primase
MSLPPNFLDELRDRVTVSSVIGRKLKLERRGREFIALCPFHGDSKPSLNIVDDKGFYHCFACGAHGDVIKFLMENDGLKFMEAVEQLASMAGMEVPKQTPEDAQRAERRRSIQDVVELACKWYERQLHTSSGDKAKRYLAERGLTASTIERFRLGWAPDDKGALLRALKSEGVEADVLVEAGLARKFDDGGMTDWMRGRVLFPITDRRGQVIAFGGRVLGDGQPKYLNSPDTPLFHKGRVLYGLAQAREQAHKTGELVVVEGYMDAIALAQVGVPAVAPLGTALTEDQIAELWRMTPEPVVSFDGDAAGQKAARRAADRALPMLKPGHSLRFMALPDGKDPDDLVRAEGAKGFRVLIDQARAMARFLWESEQAASPTDTPERRADFYARVRGLVREIADRGVQEAYQDEFDRRIAEVRRPGDVETGSGGKPFFNGMRTGYKRGRYDQKYGKTPPRWLGQTAAPDTTRLEEATRRVEEIILLTILRHPGVMDRYMEALGTVEFMNPDFERFRRLLIGLFSSDPDLDQGKLFAALRERDEGEMIEYLENNKLERSYRFAHTDTSLAEASAGLEHILRAYRIDDVNQQIERLSRDPDGMTDEGFETLQSLLAERERLASGGDLMSVD